MLQAYSYSNAAAEGKFLLRGRHSVAGVIHTLVKFYSTMLLDYNKLEYVVYLWLIPTVRSLLPLLPVCFVSFNGLFVVVVVIVAIVEIVVCLRAGSPVSL